MIRGLKDLIKVRNFRNILKSSIAETKEKENENAKYLELSSDLFYCILKKLPVLISTLKKIINGLSSETRPYFIFRGFPLSPSTAVTVVTVSS